MQTVDNRQNWTKAFKCNQCRKQNETSCPGFVNYMETNEQNGEQRLVKTCVFQMLPTIIIQNTARSSGVQKALEGVRNSIIDNFKLIKKENVNGYLEGNKEIKN